MESRRKNTEGRAPTPHPANGRYLFLKGNVWEDAVGIMQADEDQGEDEKEEEWLEAESEGERQAPPDGGAIVLNDVSIDT